MRGFGESSLMKSSKVETIRCFTNSTALEDGRRGVDMDVQLRLKLRPNHTLAGMVGIMKGTGSS